MENVATQVPGILNVPLSEEVLQGLLAVITEEAKSPESIREEAKEKVPSLDFDLLGVALTLLEALGLVRRITFGVYVLHPRRRLEPGQKIGSVEPFDGDLTWAKAQDPKTSCTVEQFSNAWDDQSLDLIRSIKYQASQSEKVAANIPAIIPALEKLQKAKEDYHRTGKYNRSDIEGVEKFFLPYYQGLQRFVASGEHTFQDSP